MLTGRSIGVDTHVNRYKCAYSVFRLLSQLVKNAINAPFLTFVAAISSSTNLYAHEAWVLTPEQFVQWNAKPRPEIFTILNSTNITLILISILFVSAVTWLERKKNHKAHSNLQTRLNKYSGYATLGVRLSLALMLGMAALGLSPRHGTGLFETATLVAPDLEIRLLNGNWQWLAWAQGAVAIALLFGMYVRMAALLVLFIDIIGLFVFGYKMFAYAGIVGGIAIYLIISGAGIHALRLPALYALQPTIEWLDRLSINRAQFLMRLLAGANLLYLGIAYKFLQPNLSMAFIEMQNVFTFGLEPETFVFCMFLVETLAGLFMVLGMMMRPLSVVLFAAFMFMAYVLGENPLGHIIFYGILWASLINGPGHWAKQRYQERIEGISPSPSGGISDDIAPAPDLPRYGHEQR